MMMVLEVEKCEIYKISANMDHDKTLYVVTRYIVKV